VFWDGLPVAAGQA